MPTADDRSLTHQLDPLLRELMAFDLVRKEVAAGAEPGVPGGERWVLTEAVQQRLSALHRPVPDQSSMFFVGHRCDRCRDHTVTRRVGSGHLCARCAAEVGAGAAERLA
jgi:hypothetical protein